MASTLAALRSEVEREFPERAALSPPRLRRFAPVTHLERG